MSFINRYNLGLFNSGTYTPNIVDIQSITQEMYPLVTTADDLSFVIGQQVQFFIPPEWGMRQLDKQTGYVISLPASNEFTVNIDTSNYDAFVTPSPPEFVVIDPAQVAGIGDANTGSSSPGGIPPNPNTIPGAYQNQSP